MKKKEVWFDMDGVMCNFAQAYIDVMKREGKGVDINHWTEIQDFSLEGLFGLSAIEANVLITAQGPDFWRNLELMEDWEHIKKEVHDWFPYDEVNVATKPMSHACINPSCLGKMQWLTDHHILTNHSQVLLSHRKHLASHSNSILVDDFLPNCLDFILESKGTVVLINRPWSHPERAERDLSKEQLERFKIYEPSTGRIRNFS